MRYSATKLRQNLYHILDMVIDEGASLLTKDGTIHTHYPKAVW